MFDGIRVAELDVLGAVLESGGRCLDEMELVGEQFEDHNHGRVFDVMKRIYSSGVAVDMAGLFDGLPATDVGLISSLGDYRGFVRNAGINADRIARQSVHRRLRDLGAGLTGLDPTMSAEEAVEYARAKVDAAAGVQKAPVRSMPDLWQETIDKITSAEVYVPTPWPSLDDAIGGFRAGALHVIGARPGVGKTLIALQIAMKLAEDGVVAYSSLEMPATELTTRAIAAHAEVNVSEFARNRLNEGEWKRVTDSRPRFVNRVYIDDRSNVGPAQVRQFARNVARKGTLRGIVVDYLQLMTAPGNDPRREKVSEFSRQMKAMAKDLNVPVFALSQLNRESENRPDKLPAISDLRESGSIEQDADLVMLLSKEESTNGLVLDIVKYRHGKQAVVKLQWRGDIAKAVDYRVLQNRA